MLLSAVLILRERPIVQTTYCCDLERLSEDLTDDLETGLRGESWVNKNDLRRIIEYFYCWLENFRS